jgi:rRNA maturation endonuclease Nob1
MNNERWNLLALCVVCHADEHPFMQPDEKTIEILQKNRQNELNEFVLWVRRKQGRCEECGGHFVDGICSQCGSEFSLGF